MIRKTDLERPHQKNLTTLPVRPVNDDCKLCGRSAMSLCFGACAACAPHVQVKALYRISDKRQPENVWFCVNENECLRSGPGLTLVERLREAAGAADIYANLFHIELELEAAEDIERLHAENFMLAANQCHNGATGEHGDHVCLEIERLSATLNNLQGTV